MDLPHTTAARTIACALIELGHNLGLKVCCEGVESEGALEFLHQVGCDFVQGYFVARPMTARALAAWINKPNTPFEALLRQAS
jgi:EAL domain-containing protein (putative c-di-GMP-specific phosphodiesterase class I)